MPTTAPRPRAGPRLAGRRLVLRPLDRGDVEAIAVLANDADVAKFTASIPHPYTRADAERWLDALEAEDGAVAKIVFAIERRTVATLLGAVGLVMAAGEQQAELGYWLGKPHWNQGYMTEAVRLVLRHAFRDLGLERVRAGAFLDNAASIRVQEKVGMRYTGRETWPAPARGGDHLADVYELSRADWSA